MWQANLDSKLSPISARNARSASFLCFDYSPLDSQVQFLSAVELLHLGLDRFKEVKRSSSTAEEDGFCKRLRQIGATWWASRAEWSNALLGERDTAKMAKIVETGWPSSGQGVWVLEYLEHP